MERKGIKIMGKRERVEEAVGPARVLSVSGEQRRPGPMKAHVAVQMQRRAAGAVQYQPASARRSDLGTSPGEAGLRRGPAPRYNLRS